MTTMMSNVAIITTIPLLKSHFTDVEDIEFLSRMMITLPSLSIAFLAPFLGHFVHNFGKRRSAIIALILFSITGSAGIYLQSIESLLLSRASFGVTVAVLMIVSTSLIGDYFKDEERHKFMGLQSVFIGIGGIIFLMSGGFLSDINWRYSFGIYLIGFVLLPFAYKYMVEVTQGEFKEDNENINSNLIPIYLLAFFLMLIFYILPTQMPFLMINEFGASGTLTGAIISAAFVANAFGAMSFAKLKKRFDFKTIYLIGLTIIGIGFTAKGFVTDVYFFFLTAPIMGFGGGIIMTCVSAWMLSRAHHSKRVKASGYLTSSLFLGQFFSPIVFHPLVATFGVQGFFIVIGLMLFTIVVTSAITLKFKR